MATVVAQNIVRSATWLLFTLAGTSGIFFLLGADFVGAMQLLVYVGGTLVLVVFGVMLTAQGPFITMKTSGAEWAISTVAGILLFGVLGMGIMAAGQPSARRLGPSLISRQGSDSTVTRPPPPSSAVLGEGFLACARRTSACGNHAGQADTVQSRHLPAAF